MDSKNTFSTLLNRMLQGMMFHSENCDYFAFLGFDGYEKLHKVQFLEESMCYRMTKSWFVKYSDLLVPDGGLIIQEAVLPDSWYNLSRKSVDSDNKGELVKTALENWNEWESGTIDIVNQCYLQLMDMGRIDLISIVLNIADDRTNELKFINDLYLEAKSVNFNSSDLMQMQMDICLKCKKNRKKLEVALREYWND